MEDPLKSLTDEYNTNPVQQNELEAKLEIKRLKKELAESQKENAFLKKAATFFAKEILINKQNQCTNPAGNPYDNAPMERFFTLNLVSYTNTILKMIGN